MFGILVRKEIAQQIITAKFSIITTLVVLLALISSAVMIRDYQLRVENYEVLKPTENDTVAIKRPLPMSVLVKGLDERMGQSITVSAFGGFTVGSSQSSANRLFALFRELDTHFIILVILSLAAVLFSFDMVSGEKRQGVLKLSLANGVSRGTILVAKWLGALVVVAIPALLAFIISLVAMQIAMPGAMTADFYLRIVVLTVITIVYLAATTAVGLLISCLTHRPATSLVFALLVWALMVFVIPNAAAMGGDIMVGGKTLAQQDVNVRHTWTSGIFKANVDTGGREWPEIRKDIAADLVSEFQDYINLTEARVGLTRTLSYLSPAGAFSFAAWAAAGTGPNDALDFKRDVVRYQAAAVEDANVLLAIARNHIEPPEGFQARIFSEQPRSLPDALTGEIVPATGILVLFSIVLFSICFFLFVRYDVR